MIEFMPETKGNVVGIRATGTLTDNDYKQVLIPKMKQLFAEYGRLRILIYMDDQFVGWDLAAAWDDATFGLRHGVDFEKIAVVGGPRWVALCVTIIAFLIAGMTRSFPADKLRDAWDWVNAA